MPKTIPSKEQAQAAVSAYAEGFNQGASGRAKWLEAFADNIEQHEPVGAPARQGKEAVGSFFDGLWQIFSKMTFTVRDVFVCAEEVAFTFTIKAFKPEGGGVEFDGVDVFTIDDSGKIAVARGFSDSAQFRPFT